MHLFLGSISGLALSHLCQLSANASFHSKTPNLLFILNTDILYVISIG